MSESKTSQKLEKKDKTNKKQKVKFGDRRDGKRIRNTDAMHVFMPYLLPKRCDNEACLNDFIDVKNAEAFVAEKNAQNPSFKYTVFHLVVAAIAKTIYLRPKLNYFYQGHRLYERNEISFAFVVKRTFEDKSQEVLAIVKVDPESEVSPLEQIHSKVEKIVTSVRKKDANDGATDIMDMIKKMPRFAIKAFVGIINFLDYHGWLPRGFVNVDPYHCSMFLSNLGSIKSTASYHHLANWGTNSLFMLIGEMKNRPGCDQEGNLSIRKKLPISLTVDERIADGFYFAKSVKILKYLLENPELLEKPFCEPIQIDL